MSWEAFFVKDMDIVLLIYLHIGFTKFPGSKKTTDSKIHL